MLQFGEATGLFGFQSDQIEGLADGSPLSGDHRPALNRLLRRLATRHPALLRHRVPGEQSQLLALDLSQIEVRPLQRSDRRCLQRHPTPTRAAIAATARSTTANPRVPSGTRWL